MRNSSRSNALATAFTVRAGRGFSCRNERNDFYHNRNSPRRPPKWLPTAVSKAIDDFTGYPRFLNDLRAIEKQLVAAEWNASQSHENPSKLRGALDATRGELVTSKQEHHELKDLVKIVAGELKDQR
jgi:hypothetical protein